MTLLKNYLGVSLILLFLTYSIEGWLYGSWAMGYLAAGTFFIQLSELTRLGILYGIAIGTIVFFVIVFTSPIALFAISLDNWLKSDTRAFISIFLGAFAVTIILEQLHLFARFLVLTASALLLKLDLQLIGWNRWLCSLALTVFCCLGFTGGILAFYLWS